MAMDSRMSSVSLENYINTLDPCNLPRVIEVTEGVYDEGSIYDFTTTAGTLSTGDIIKVTGTSLFRVSATLCDSDMRVIPNSEVKISADYRGLFGRVPYQDKVSSEHHNKMTLTEVLQEKLTMVIPDNYPNTIVPPIPGLPSGYENILLIKPVYTVRGVLQETGRKFKFLSNLDVEVKDITEACISDFKTDRAFYSLNDVFGMAEELPLLMEVCESSNNNLSFRKSYVACEVGTKLWMHAARVSSKYLVTHTAGAQKGQAEKKYSLEREHFLVPPEYKGQFRRLPQKFRCLYEINLKEAATTNMQFMATQSWESDHSELASVDAGDRFEALECATKRIGGREIKVLKAENILDSTTVMLADYSDGSFMEIVHHKTAPVSISQIMEAAPVPCEVKLVNGDGMPGDPLVSIQGTLVVENQVMDRCLVASIASGPDHVTRSPFEIPIDRVFMAVRMYPCGSSETTPTVAIEDVVNVEKLSPQGYDSLITYEQAPCYNRPPPIPNRQQTVKEHKAPKAKVKKAKKKAGNEKPTEGHTYSRQPTQIPLEETTREDSDDVHDYESINDDDLEELRAMFAMRNTWSNV